jgi:hypothetical protein
VYATNPCPQGDDEDLPNLSCQKPSVHEEEDRPEAPGIYMQTKDGKHTTKVANLSVQNCFCGRSEEKSDQVLE